MHKAARGWGEFGMPYPSLWAIAKEFRVVFVGTGRDDHSRFIAVEPV
jgi:hypothetical protein